MTIQLIKTPGFVETTANPPTASTHWTVIGSLNEQDVQAYVLAGTPSIVATIYGVLLRQDLRLRQTAYNQWSATVPYGNRPNATGEWSWDFDTTGGLIHITNAKAEVGRYPSDKAPNQQGAIGVEGDTVKGTDIVIPALKINVSFRHPAAEMTLARAKFLAGVTGTVNSAPFLSFSPGEVLFLGARGSDGSQAEATVNYQFAMSSNVTNLSIGEIADIVKRGHDVAWVRYEDKVQTTGGESQPTRVPKFVYVDQVYSMVDHRVALGFG